MRTNTLKQKLNAGQTTIGTFVNFPSPAMVEALGWLGMDFVIIDCEHGIMDYQTAEHMIRAAELADITPIVRVGMNVQQHIQRYMDGGAAGVLIPFVNDGALGKAVVDSVKYPPMGRRGFFGGRSWRRASTWAPSPETASRLRTGASEGSTGCRRARTGSLPPGRGSISMIAGRS